MLTIVNVSCLEGGYLSNNDFVIVTKYIGLYCTDQVLMHCVHNVWSNQKGERFFSQVITSTDF